MTTDAQQATADRAARPAPAPAATTTDPASGAPDKRSAPPGKPTKPAKPAKAPARRPRQAAQNPKRRPYHAEIVALADTTAELPPPWRQQAIALVHAIMSLFQRIWGELRQRLPPVAAADAEGPGPADPGDLPTPD